MRPDSSANVRQVWFDAAPNIAAALAFAAGFVTILTVAVPSLPHARGLDAIERLIEEFPEFSASVAGVVLMALATGLRQRIDSAWAAATALFAAGSLYAFFRHNHLPLAAVSALLSFLLLVSRRAFYRRSRLPSLAPGRRVALAIAGALAVGAFGALLWAGGRPGFGAAPWRALFTDPHLGRPGRSLTFAVAAFAVVMANRYFLSRAKGAPRPAGDADIARVARVIANTPDAPPDAQVAFTGDKSFLFSGDAFIMAARGGASLISMSGPIGCKDDWRGALLAFRAEAARLSLRPVVYAAPPELLPDLIDLGFRPEKVGENAMVDLQTFSLKGQAKQNLRTARRRLVEREGAAFEVISPPFEPSVWPQLQSVSDAWLDAHGGKEKSFSLGAFSAEYLSRHSIAIVRRNHSIIAFANIWVNAGRKRAAVDLMRFDPGRSSNGLMDFLLTETLLWAQNEEFEVFDLGMAPLTGLSDDQYASWFARLGRLVAHYGEPLYSFEGLRSFKEKFDPKWEPRYISAPGAWSLPIVLAEVGLLTNGGRK